jgi:hypothetical protein
LEAADDHKAGLAVERRIPRNTLNVALLDALAKFWEEVIGAPAEAAVRGSFSGEVRGAFVEFARTVGRIVKIPISDNLIRTRRRVWRKS